MVRCRYVDDQPFEDLDVVVRAVSGADRLSLPELEDRSAEPAIDPIRLVHGYLGGLYGFCSSHAANTMSCGLLFSLIYRNKIATTGLMTWVALNCYSRMYLGAHYPGDILAGLFIGSLFAVLAYWALCRWVLRSPAASCSHPLDGEAARQGGS